jgi:hypothetical protein
MTKQWPEPWQPVADRERLLLEQELQRELGDGHRLAGLSLKIVARRDDRDDVLVVIDSGVVAEVHLTWSGRREADPRWPTARIFGSMDEWRLSCGEQ